MRFHKDHLDGLTKAVAKGISDNEEKIYFWTGFGYILDEEVLEEVVRKALEEY